MNAVHFHLIIEYMYKETIIKDVCKHHQWQQQGQHWNMSITIYLYKLIIPDLTKNTWYDDFCLYFLVSVWETSTKPGCNRCFFASKYGVALSFCVARTSGRNEVNAFKNVLFFWTKLCLFFLKIDDNILNVNCYLPAKLREVQWNMLI